MYMLLPNGLQIDKSEPVELGRRTSSTGSWSARIYPVIFKSRKGWMSLRRAMTAHLRKDANLGLRFENQDKQSILNYRKEQYLKGNLYYI